MSNPAHQAGSNIDHRRRSVSLPKRLVPVILAIHAGDPPHHRKAAAELRADGLMTSKRLDPLVTSLLQVMTNPTMVITVELAGARSPRLATIWGTPSGAVIGMTSDRHQFDLTQIEPNLLPFHMAQAIGLTPRPHPPFSGGCTVPVAALDLAEQLIGADPATAETQLVRAGVAHPWGDRILTTLAHRRSVWTVESIWLGDGAGRRELRLVVLDAGPAGYWRLDRDIDGVSIAVSDFDELMRRFGALVSVRPRHPSSDIEI